MNNDLLLNQVAEEFTQRVRKGKPADVEEFANRHPALAGRIRELLSALVLIEEAAEAKRNASSDQTSTKYPQPAPPRAEVLPHSALIRKGKI